MFSSFSPVDPERTALILIGFQNDYFAADGALHSVIESDGGRVLATTLRLLDALAGGPVHIISTPIQFTEGYEELEEPVGILAAIRALGAFHPGSSGSKTVPEFAAYRRSIVEIGGKRGLNAFAETRLDAYLQGLGVRDVVLAGVVTSICIDSTARSAHERGYRVHVLADATAGRTSLEQQFYCEHIFPLYARVLEANEFIAEARPAP